LPPRGSARGHNERVQRVAVVGPGGAGKSTFATRLGRLTGLPVIHLDQHYWRPGWVEPSRDEWRRIQVGLVAGEQWIADGNYGGTLDVRLERADTVIVLQPARLVCVGRALRRSLRHRGEAVQAPSCPERVDPAFLRWIWRYPRDSRPRLDAALARHRDHLTVVELRSRKEAADFLLRAS
jgi:adenylate kinase family enzyme